MAGNTLRRAATLLVVVLSLVLVVGSLLGQPVLFSFVTSESMSPTLEEGDGFVAIPQQVAGDVEVGDVVIFRAQELDGGGLTTHRVVGETENGYVTKGDGNPFTDQDGVEPPVTEAQIVATAWQPGGEVLRIPFLGTAIIESRQALFGAQAAVTETLGLDGADSSQQMGSSLIVVGLVLLIVVTATDLFGDGGARERTRSRGGSDDIKPRYILLFLIAVAVVPANATMVLPSGTTSVPIADIADSTETEPGETVEFTLSAKNGGLVTMLIIFEAPQDGTLSDQSVEVPGGGEVSLSASATVPPPGGSDTVEVSEQRYVLLLPPWLLISLHEIHPLAALAAINAILAFSVVTLVVGVAGIGGRRARETDRGVRLSVRIKRFVRGE